MHDDCCRKCQAFFSLLKPGYSNQQIKVNNRSYAYCKYAASWSVVKALNDIWRIVSLLYSDLQNMASSAYKNKTGLPFLFSFCLNFFNKLSENVGEAAGSARSCGGSSDRRRFSYLKAPQPPEVFKCESLCRLLNSTQHARKGRRS